MIMPTRRLPDTLDSFAKDISKLATFSIPVVDTATAEVWLTFARVDGRWDSVEGGLFRPVYHNRLSVKGVMTRWRDYIEVLEDTEDKVILKFDHTGYRYTAVAFIRTVVKVAFPSIP